MDNIYGRKLEKHEIRDNPDIMQGIVWEVNHQRMTMHVKPSDSGTLILDVPIASAYTGPSGYLAVMPERGALVVLLKVGSKSLGYVPIAYLSSTDDNYKVVDTKGGDTPGADEDSEQRRFLPTRRRLLMPGEATIAGRGGADAFFDTDFELTDANHNFLRMRASTGTLLRSSTNTHSIGAGIRESTGYVVRNAINDLKGSSDLNPLYYPVIHEDGTRSVYLGSDPTLGYAYTEYRRETNYHITGDLIAPDDVTDEIDTRDDKSYDHLYVEGNLIGADSNNTKHYAKMLRPQVLRGSTDKPNGPDDFEVLNTQEENNRFGVSYGNHIRGVHLRMVDREGMLHEMYGKSSQGRTSGKSRETSYQGSVHTRYGIGSEGKSWDVHAEGIIKWDFMNAPTTGTDGIRSFGWDVKSKGRVRMIVGDIGDDGGIRNIEDYAKGSFYTQSEVNEYSYIHKQRGAHRTDIDGKHERMVSGNGAYHYGGSYFLRTASYMASYGSEYTAAANAMNIMATQSHSTSTAKHTLTVAGGLLPTSNEKVLLGFKKISADLGITFESLLGSIALNAPLLGISMASGTSISQTAPVNNITGNMVMSGGNYSSSYASHTTTANSISNIAPSVTLGLGAYSPVLTTLTAPCYVTGLLSPGSLTVKASS